MAVIDSVAYNNSSEGGGNRFYRFEYTTSKYSQGVSRVDWTFKTWYTGGTTGRSAYSKVQLSASMGSGSLYSGSLPSYSQTEWKYTSFNDGKTYSGGASFTVNTSGTFYVSHNASGNASVSIAIKSAIYSTTWKNASGTISITGNVPATKSTCSAANGTIGSKTTITVSKATSGVSDSLYYRYYYNGAWSSVNAITSGVTASSYSWTIPTSLANYVPTNSKTLTCDIYWDSYYSGTYIGGGYSSNFTVTMPASLGAPTGLTLGSLSVQGKTATFNIGTPSFKYGASLSSYTITPSKGAASRSGNVVTITFNENITSDVTVSVYATDTRGFTSNTATITISPVDLTSKTLTLSPTSYTYDGTAKKPAPSISGLTSGTGYSIAYSNNTNAGTATATATGIGAVKGSISKTFTIKPKSIEDMTLSIDTKFFGYDGTAKKPTPSISGLTLNTDYTVSYSNNTNIGIGTITATGKGNYTGTVSTTFEILDKSLPTVLKTLFRKRTMPISEGGTGATTSAGAVTNLKSEIVDIIYPVNSIYMSINSTNPKTLFGGDWVQLKDRFLLAQGSSYSAGATGGAATVALTTDTMPSHTHTFTGSASSSTSAGAHTHDAKGGAAWNGSSAGIDSYASYFSTYYTLSSHVYAAGDHYHTATSSGSNKNAGSGTAHNNMPPYLVVYMWKRTA